MFKSSNRSSQAWISAHWCVSPMRICISVSEIKLLLDTASIYRNEEDVAKGIAASGVQRKDIFITSKVAPGEQGYEGWTLIVFIKTYLFIFASQRHLLHLRRRPQSLALITWICISFIGLACKVLQSEIERTLTFDPGLKMSNPRNSKLRADTWRALEKLYEEGVVVFLVLIA